MGRGMCKNLASKGALTSPLMVYNRTASRAEQLAKEVPNTVAVASITDAVSKADIIFTCVADDKVIQATIETALKTDSLAGKLFVDCSTVHPDTTRQLAKDITARGARFVAGPVFGAPAMADTGQLVCVLAGPKEDVDRVKPYCMGVMGRAVIDFSDQDPGKASLLKVLGNTFILHMVETLAEGLTVAEKTGLGTDQLHQFVEMMFPGPFAAYSTRMRSGDYYKRAEPLFAVDLARKDAGHALSLAESVGAKMKGVQVADQYLAQVKKHMGARGDIAGVYGAVRQDAGLKFENDSTIT